MKETVSGCFFLNTVYLFWENFSKYIHVTYRMLITRVSSNMKWTKHYFISI